MSDPQNVELSEQWQQLQRLLRSRGWTVLTFLTVTMLVVIVGTSLQTRLYRASVTVLIDMESPNVLSVSTSRDDSTVAQTNYMTYADYYRTQMEIIKSRAIAQRVFSNLKLGEQRRYAEAKDPVGELMSQVKVEPIKQTRLTRIFVEDPNPIQAARIANELGIIFVEENLARTASSESLTLMKNEYLKLLAKETELSKRYKNKFPTMVRIRQQMDQLARAIEDETTHQVREARLQAEGASILQTEESLGKYGKGSVMGGLRPNNIRVQDLAQPPIKPSKPSAKLNLLLSLFLGLLGGISAGVIEELLDSSIKVAEDVERDKRFVYLGYVPRFDMSNRIPIHTQPYSPAAEAYRTIRTNLVYAAPHVNAKAVIVTSPGSEEGKSTTISNLGVALSQIGIKVLIVDADLRRPRLHDVFKVEQKPGLSEYLIGKESLEKVIKPTGIPGVSIVPSGVSPPNPAELLGLPQMRQFLDQTAARFDRVLIDAPPVIPVTDAVILAAMTGAVLAVAQSGKTPRQALYRLTSLVNDVQARILGVVLNNVPPNFTTAYSGYTPYQYGNPQNKDVERNNKAGNSALEKIASLLKRFTSSGKADKIRGEGKPTGRSMEWDAKTR